MDSKKAINEKKNKNYNVPDSSLALALHTIFGLNRYPNYLYRFREGEELDRMESLLEDFLETIKKQKREIAVMASLKMNFLQLNDDSLTMNASSAGRIDLLNFWLSPSLFQSFGCHVDTTIRDFMSSPVSPLIQAVLGEELEVDEAVEGLFFLEIFNKNACDFLIGRSNDFAKYLHMTSEDALANFRKRPPPLNYMGLEFMEDFLLYIVNIIAPLTFPEYIQNSELDWSQAYIAGYTEAKESDRSQSTITSRKDSDRSGLVKHTDDSEITCNIALNDSYNGGELLIRGIRGDIQENEIRAKVKRETGTMIIHSGRRIHEVADVTSGSRYQLICWTRNIRDLRSRSCPCCWINHREERGQEANISSSISKQNLTSFNTCICSKSWN